MAPAMYREHESVRRVNGQSRWLFNTIAVHDVEDAYSKPVVQRLLDDYGFHFAHTYLASMSRAHLSHALERHPSRPQHWRLTPRFSDNLANMSRLQSDGQLWVASIGEVCAFWQQLREVSILPEGNGVWRIDSGANELSVPFVVVGGEDCVLRRTDDIVQTEPLGSTSQIGCLPLGRDNVWLST
jgi:hypothetical protein